MTELVNLEKMYKTRNFLVMDTETTGLYDGSEIVQFGLIDQDGKVLFDLLIKPHFTIPRDASAIHGIYDTDVKDSPTWAMVREPIANAMRGKNVIIYNQMYDRLMLNSTDDVNGIKDAVWDSCKYACAMLGYAEFNGAWNAYRNSYKWWKLTHAMDAENLGVIDAHGAVGDCRMTLRLLNHMFKLE